MLCATDTVDVDVDKIGWVKVVVSVEVEVPSAVVGGALAVFVSVADVATSEVTLGEGDNELGLLDFVDVDDVVASVLDVSSVDV